MADVLNKNFANLRTIFEEVLKIKNGGVDKKADELADKRKYASLLFVLIKKINRMVKYRVRSGREELHREKLQVDSNRLQLQNLLYEVGHLKREIRHCHQFKSQDEDIELLPEQEYLTLVQPVVTKHESAHTKRLARLEWELSLRKQLSEHCKDLTNSKKQVFQEIVLKMERLTSFAPSLRTLLKATRPLQEALQVPMDREWKLSQLVQLLPQPLYLAYMNIHALEVAAEADVVIAVVGSEKDLHQAEVATQSGSIKNGTSSDNDELDLDLRKRKSYVAPTVETQRQVALEPHPLMVRFSIGNANNPEECIVVVLRYFDKLGFVTAATEINLNESDWTASEISSSQDILKYLYDDDLGDNIPVTGAEYQLKKFDMSTDECVQYLNTKALGKPYRWLQRMCCIEVYNQLEVERTENKIQKIIPEIIKRIQEIWASRLNLITQTKALVNKNIDLYLKAEKQPLVKPACSLVQWTCVIWDEYVANNCTAQYIEQELVNTSHVFYRAVVVRGSAKMECLISVSNKFPTDSPLWAICVYWNGQHNALNNSAIKMMEYWTNALSQTQLDNKLALLSAQLLRTMYSFDIFLETEGPYFTPVEYHKEKHFIKAFSKRIRARPYRYIEDGTINSFKQ